jgi:hypothetical protein
MTLYLLLVLCHCVHCCLQKSVQCLWAPHNTPYFCSVLLCPLFSSKICQLSVSTSHWNVCWSRYYFHCWLLESVHCLTVPYTVILLLLCHCVHCCPICSVHSSVFISHYTVCCSMPLCSLLSSTLRPLSVSTSQNVVFCSLHFFHCCLLQSVQRLPVHHTALSLCSVSLCPMLSSKICSLFLSASHCTVCWFCDVVYSTLLYILSTVCQFPTL